MTLKIEFLEWLKEQDGYYVNLDDAPDRFRQLDLNLVGVTVKMDDDGNSLVPKRDIRRGLN